jgi:peptidoglycan/xylan/chitin deacetylase (PgdA/CDA1 family)
VKAALRRQIISRMNRAGLFARIAKSHWRRKRLLILCYHGVSIADEHLWDPRMFFSLEAFRARMELLRKWRCVVLPLGEALARLQAGDLPERAVALTFDDGNCDFHDRAWPVLRESGYPATVYLTTYYSGRTDPVFPGAYGYVAWRGRSRVVDASSLIDGDARSFDLRSTSERDAFVNALVQYADRVGLTADEKGSLLGRLAEQVGVDLEEVRRRRILRIMNPADVAEVSSAGVAVELHTHRHRTPESRELFLREISDNSASILAMTGKAPSHFCYPNGVYRRMFAPWLRQADIASATTCVPGLASQESDVMALPRFVDRSPVSSEEFEAWITGAATLFPSLRRLLTPRSWFSEA